MTRTTSAVAFAAAVLIASSVLGQTIIVGGGPSPGVATLGNGNFEADSGSPLSFAAVTNWHSLEGNDATANFGQTNGMAGSPEPNSQGGFIFGQLAANDTGYVASTGDVFDIDFYANRFGGGWDGDEGFEVVLFTSTTGVDANTDAATDITILSTTLLPVTSGWSNYSQDGIYTATAADAGQTIYLGFDLSNANGNAVFPRLDVITWEVTSVPEPSCLASLSLLSLLWIRRKITS